MEGRAVSGGRILEGDDVVSDTAVSCDVCVIGSGSGGAWTAHELAARGRSVVLLEEGGYHTRREFDLTAATRQKLQKELGSLASPRTPGP